MHFLVTVELHAHDSFACAHDVHLFVVAERLDRQHKFHSLYIPHLSIIPYNYLVGGIVWVLPCGHQENDIGLTNHLHDREATFKCSLELLHELWVERVIPETLVGRQHKVVLSLIK